MHLREAGAETPLPGREAPEKSLNEYRDRMAWKSVEVLEDGRIKAVRSMATGGSRLKAGGDATRTEDYEVIYEDQTLYLSGPGALQLAGGSAGLFDNAFNLNKVAEDSAKAQEEYQKNLQNSANRLANKQNESDDLNNQMYASAQSAISAQADLASKVQDLAVTILSGGTLGSWMKSQVQGLMGQALEDLTGLPAGIFANLASGMRIDKAITKGITDRAKQMAFAEIDKATGLSGAGAFMMEKFEKSQASKKSHASQRGLNALNPANFQHTTVGKAMMNSNNPLVTAAAAGMTGNPMLLNVALMQTANMAMPDGMRTKVAKTMDKAGRWMEDNNGLIAKAAAATAIAAGSPPTMAAAGMGVFVAGGTKAVGGAMRSSARVVATGAQTIAEAQDAVHTRNDANIQNALETGKARHEARMKKYEQMTLGSGLQELMSPVSELAKVLSKPVPQKSEAQVEFETSLANGWAEVSGWPKEFTRSMFVDGANMEEAISAQAYGNLNAVIPGAAQEMQEYLARRDLKNKRGRASKIKPEDFATGGLTYAWRNAEYNKDGAIALQVAETTAAVVVNVVPGLGQAASAGIFAYMTGKQIYQGSLHGGTKGALAGAVSGALTGLVGMGKPGLSAGISYDFENGWGTNIGVSGGTEGGATAGGSLNFQEGEGFTGAGLNFGYTGNTGYGGTIGASVDRYGAFSGASVKGSYRNSDIGVGKDAVGEGSIGMRLGADGKYAGTDISYTNTIERAIDSRFANPLNTIFGNTASGRGSTSYTIGGGLSFNNDQSFSVNSILGVGITDDYRAGFHGVAANQNVAIQFNRDGEFTGTQTNIDLQMKFQTRATALTQLQKDVMSGKLKGADLEQLKKQIATLRGEEKKLEWAYENRDSMQKALENKYGREFTGEEIDQILAGNNKDISVDTAVHETAVFIKTNLNPAMRSGQSRESVYSQVTGFLGDTVDSLFLNKYADEAGFVDPESGDWVPNTCFSASTPVWTPRGKVPIETVKAGDTVLSYNLKTGNVEERRVTQTYVNHVDHKLTVEYANGETIGTTKDHPFYVSEGGWRKAMSLKTGQHSVTARTLRAGKRMIAGVAIYLASFGIPANAGATTHNGPEIAGISIEEGVHTVHNFEVEGTHTYFVGEDGVLVHNQSGPNDFGYFGVEMARRLCGDDECRRTFDGVLQSREANMDAWAKGQAIGGALVITGAAFVALPGPTRVIFQQLAARYPNLYVIATEGGAALAGADGLRRSVPLVSPTVKELRTIGVKGFQVHHILPEYLGKMLGFTTKEMEHHPGILVSQVRHTGASNPDAIHKVISQFIPYKPGVTYTAQQISQRLEAAYTKLGQPELFEAIRPLLEGK